ncbi:hypothetical protein ACIBL3_29635 [Kribbella sp. NPDC050124]|uniref:hypothetical protein n=1 Tax=Kribbella sp. NPDC050124 TaxID=3364114 RepID=UPI00379F8261
MSTIHLHATTIATPEQYLAALLDFGPGRSKTFGNSSDDYLEVHVQGPHFVEATEGSAGVWERLHYDWSDPNHVVIVTTDSNVWGTGSSYTYIFTREPHGTTAIDAVVVRRGKNIRGRILDLILSTVGKNLLIKAFHDSVIAVEARNTQKIPADSK